MEIGYVKFKKPYQKKVYQPIIKQLGAVVVGGRLLHRHFGKASEAEHYARSVAMRYQRFCEAARKAGEVEHAAVRD